MPGMLLNEWRLSEDGYLLIDEKVLTTINRYRQLSDNSLEAGGILLGYRRDPHVEVTSVTEPGALDIRTRTRFERKDPVHQQIAAQLWEKDPYIHYLGEWHTHPEPYPSPSSLDQREWRILGKSYHPEKLIMLIQGYDDCWLGMQHHKKSIRLTSL